MKYTPPPPVNLEKEIELSLKSYYPEMKPEALNEMMKPIRDEMRDLIKHDNTLEFNKEALKIHIDESIALKKKYGNLYQRLIAYRTKKT